MSLKFIEVNVRGAKRLVNLNNISTVTATSEGKTIVNDYRGDTQFWIEESYASLKSRLEEAGVVML